MNMNMNEWPGTKAERKLRRAQLLGEAWVSKLRAKPDELASWISVIRERTRVRDRWLWASRHLPDETLDKSRAQVAGDIMLSGFADGSLSQASAHWFDAAAQTDEWAEGWLFDEECLRADGWVEATGEANGVTWHGWRRTPGS